ncbi:hypothetical protein RRG08_031584 [Elysia crispata]|uniref:Uncharacterized protein n=1 Tax=Elysia crispata TaxID=231223 RepID=A0AAE1B2X0_9GAST|nr:hypothetical protein RRG08_031584 [Elysia crispata]
MRISPVGDKLLFMSVSVKAFPGVFSVYIVQSRAEPGVSLWWPARPLLIKYNPFASLTIAAYNRSTLRVWGWPSWAGHRGGRGKLRVPMVCDCRDVQRN